MKRIGPRLLLSIPDWVHPARSGKYLCPAIQGQEPWPELTLTRQLGKRKRVSADQLKHRIPEKERILAVIEPKRELVKVGGKVLDAQMVICTNHAAVEQRPNALDGVRVNVAANPFVREVANRFVPRVLVPASLVRPMLVGIDRFRVVSDYITEKAMDRLSVGSLCYAEPDFATALDRAENHRLSTAPASIPARLAVLRVPRLATDVRLVSFHDSRKLRSVAVVHRGSNAVAEIPSCLVAHGEHPLELVGADPLLGLHHQVDGQEPLPKRQVRILKDCSRANRELVATVRADRKSTV